MAVLRGHRETLLNVLEPFLRDPTVGWTRLGKAQRDDDARGTAANANVNANDREDPAKTLRVIEQRLSGVYNLPVPPPPGSQREREDRAAARSRGRTNGPSAARSPESAADLLPLSVPGQVQRLINEATAETNLCRMYLGWTPFL